MTGVDKDLATLRSWDASWVDRRNATARVEAELSRLREERDALEAELGRVEERVGVQAQFARDLEAAEARYARLTEENERLDGLRALYLQSADDWSERCARLQQALQAFFDEWDGDVGTCAPTDDTEALMREALAGQPAAAEGPDTPADICPECGSGLITLHIAAYPCSRRNTPATDWPRFAREILDGDTDAIAARLPEFLRPDADTPADSQPEEPT